MPLAAVPPVAPIVPPAPVPAVEPSVFEGATALSCVSDDGAVAGAVAPLVVPGAGVAAGDVVPTPAAPASGVAAGVAVGEAVVVVAVVSVDVVDVSLFVQAPSARAAERTRSALVNFKVFLLGNKRVS